MASDPLVSLGIEPTMEFSSSASGKLPQILDVQTSTCMSQNKKCTFSNDVRLTVAGGISLEPISGLYTCNYFTLTPVTATRIWP